MHIYFSLKTFPSEGYMYTCLYMKKIIFNIIFQYISVKLYLIY